MFTPEAAEPCQFSPAEPVDYLGFSTHAAEWRKPVSALPLPM